MGMHVRTGALHMRIAAQHILYLTIFQSGKVALTYIWHVDLCRHFLVLLRVVSLSQGKSLSSVISHLFGFVRNPVYY